MEHHLKSRFKHGGGISPMSDDLTREEKEKYLLDLFDIQLPKGDQLMPHSLYQRLQLEYSQDESKQRSSLRKDLLLTSSELGVKIPMPKGELIRLRHPCFRSHTWTDWKGDIRQELTDTERFKQLEASKCPPPLVTFSYRPQCR